MVRDSESERQAIKLGVRRSSLILMPDCVFGWLPILDRSEIKQPSSSLLSIVLREAHDIRLFLPTLQNVLVRSERARTFNRFQLVIQADEDRLVTEQFAKSLSHEGLDAQIINTASASPAELVDVYRASAVTISARLHGAIFSLLAGTPAIAIAVDPGKSEGVMAEVGLRDWVLEPDPLASEHLFNRLVEATQDSTVENIRILIKAAVEKLRASESEVRSLLDRANSRRATT
jgi:polysaccharide pyruvyl transferase WcaK-like protein